MLVLLAGASGSRRPAPGSVAVLAVAEKRPIHPAPATLRGGFRGGVA